MASALSAQCALVCTQNIQVSLPQTGQFSITPNFIAPTAGTYCPGPLTVTLYNAAGQALPSNTLTCAYEGQTLTATVKHTASGNQCSGTISVEDLLAPALSCPDRLINCSTDPHPSVIGTPSMNDNCTPSYNLQLQFADQVTDLPCGTQHNGQPVTKLIERTWWVTDAQGNASNCLEHIRVRGVALSDVVFPSNRDDVSAPSLSCGDDPTDLNLTGQPLIGDAPIENDGPCSMGVTHTDQIISGCSPMSYTVIRTWTVVDFCTNQILNRIQIIRVADKVAPTFSIPATLSVGTLETGCVAHVNLPAATSVSDNCSAVSIQPTWQFGSGFGPFLNVPEGTYTVTYLATDACGNTATRTLSLTVADDDPPQVICNSSLQISIGSNGTGLVNAAALNSGSWDNCGAIFLAVSRNDSVWANTVTLNCADVGQVIPVTLRVTDGGGRSNFCVVDITARDFQKPTLACPPHLTLSCLQDPTNLALTGVATATDNCVLQSIDFQNVGTLDGCNSGSITRTWSAADVSGNTRTCVQNITLTPTNTLSVSFPANLTLNTCSQIANLDPNQTGQPTLSGQACFAPSVTYTDQVFTQAPPTCFRVLRRWRVIDHCTYNPNVGTVGIWEHTQQISVTDQSAPVLSVPASITVSPNQAGCVAQVSLPAPTATDCSSNLVFSHNSPFAYSTTAGNASGLYPLGTHTVTYTVADGCGNVAAQTSTITVIDQTAPTAVCLHGLSINLASGSAVTLNPNAFNAGSSDLCTPANALTYSLQPAFVGCQHVGNQPVTLRVTDQAGNVGQCQTFVQVQDNFQVCLRHRIEGTVRTPQGVPVVGIAVQDGHGHTATTDATGHYRFDSLTAGLNYAIRPVHNGNWLNGVTTYDLVLISRHILTLEPLDSPEKMLAADANASGTITSFDIVQLRKLIMGSIDTIAGAASWRFVPQAFVFSNPMNAFESPAPAHIDVLGLDGDVSGVDFEGIKVGDLNLNADPSMPFAPGSPAQMRRVAEGAWRKLSRLVE
jgi:hypothetical protein